MNVETIELTVAGFRYSGLAAGPPSGDLVLCLHGFPQFADSYRSLLVRLGEAGYRAVAVNQRGYSPGARPLRVEDYHLERLTDDVSNFADALEAKKFHLVGHDWGGVVAWNYAAKNPQRLRSLNVLSTPHLDALRDSLTRDPRQILKSSYIALFRAPFHLAEKVIQAFDWAFLRNALGDHLSNEQVQVIITRLSEPHALTSALNWYRALEIKEIGPITVTTLFLWGSRDQALGRTAAVNTTKFIDANFRFEVLEGASHWLLDENADVVASNILLHISPQS